MPKPFDTYATTTWLVKLTADAKVFEPKGDLPEKVILKFADNSRFEGHEVMWVDAHVRKFYNDFARQYKKGDVVQITGKLRAKKDAEGTLRYFVWDADVHSFANFGRKAEDAAADEPF